MSIIKNITKLCVGAIFLAVSFTAYASVGTSADREASKPSIQGTGNSVTGIFGLDVGGTLYDVSFFNDSYDNVFSSSTPTFLGDSALAEAAALSISSVLSGAGVTGILDLTRINDSPIFIDIASALSRSTYDTWSAQFDTAWSTSFTGVSTGSGILTSLNPISTAHAVFSLAAVASVPEPSSIYLLGFGLLGLFGVARRKV